MDLECDVRMWRVMEEDRENHTERWRYMDKKGLEMAVTVNWFSLCQVRSLLMFGSDAPTVALAT